MSLFVIFSLLFPLTAVAQYWSFGAPLDVTQGPADKLYHHLESAGRRNIAVSADTVAIVWEDNRSGNPAVYLALKTKTDKNFTTELKISAQGEAFEPALVALPDNRFAVSWEEDAKVFVRIINAQKPGSPMLAKTLQLPAKEVLQSGLTTNGDQIFVTFSQRSGRYNHIQLVQLEVDHEEKLQVIQNCPVDPEPVNADQLYPTALIVNKRIMIAWEDRRPGHTIIMANYSQLDKFCQFPIPQRISKRSESGQRKLPYGKGHGVSRVALGQYGQSEILAAWADKRNFRDGYDIYSAIFDQSGTWRTNQSVQDEFGGVARQWHSTVAGHSTGRQVVAWSDERENNSDIFYSWFEDNEWSEDTAITGASGSGEQTHPAITFDNEANLHIAWIERQQVGGSTRLRYLFGRLQHASK